LASTTGTIATLNSTTGTIATLNSTTGTIATLNSTTGTIGNLSTTIAGDFTISNGTGTLGTSGATAGTYGSVTEIPFLTIDTKGRITSATTGTFSTTPAAGSITFPMLSTSGTEADNVAKRTAKAWVNFNGIGTVAIRDDFNVSSITDNNIGDYTINFSTALSSASYCVTGCATHDGFAYTSVVMIDSDNSGMQAGTCRINLMNYTGSAYVDAQFACVAMFL
jgi:hypothetical protein